MYGTNTDLGSYQERQFYDDNFSYDNNGLCFIWSCAIILPIIPSKPLGTNHFPQR